MNDDSLFSVNVNKDGLKEKRAKLKADRFKKKADPGRSIYEQRIVKNL